MKPILCGSCGKLTRSDRESCIRCGAALPMTPAQKRQDGTQTVPSAPKSDTMVNVSVVLVLVAVVWFIFSLISNAREARIREAAAAPLVEVVSNSAWDGSVSQVEQWLQRNLKDPRSFEAIEWGKVVKTDTGFLVRCRYRAKNSYGGYAIEEQFFALSPSGAVTGAVPVR